MHCRYVQECRCTHAVVCRGQQEVSAQVGQWEIPQHELRQLKIRVNEHAMQHNTPCPCHSHSTCKQECIHVNRSVSTIKQKKVWQTINAHFHCRFGKLNKKLCCCIRENEKSHVLNLPATIMFFIPDTI